MMHKDFLKYNVQEWTQWLFYFFNNDAKLDPRIPGNRLSEHGALSRLYEFLKSNNKSSFFLTAILDDLEFENTKDLKDDYKIYTILKLLEIIQPIESVEYLKLLITNKAFLNSTYKNVFNRIFLLRVFHLLTTRKVEAPSRQTSNINDNTEFLKAYAIRTKIEEEKIELLRAFSNSSHSSYFYFFDYLLVNSVKNKTSNTLLINSIKEFIYYNGGKRYLDYFIDQIGLGKITPEIIKNTEIIDYGVSILNKNFKDPYEVLLSILIVSKVLYTFTKTIEIEGVANKSRMFGSTKIQTCYDYTTPYSWRN